jgi:GNAT superfamily N-acetyltransferase
MSTFSIRAARPEDASLIVRFIHRLAEYERLSDRCFATEETISQHLFGPHPFAEAVLAYEADAPVGFALFFHNYSTFLAKPGIYIEDLFVEPASRGKGYGKALLLHIFEIARERGCGRVEWAVLNWNEPAIRFYESMRATALGEWTVYRVTGADLDVI